MEDILCVSGLSKSYGSALALYDVTVNLPKGKIIGLLGPNGSGKTTLLKLCAGLLVPTVGGITICGEPVGPGTKSLVSYLPDRTYLNNRQTVEEQLAFFQDFYTDFDRERAEGMLKILGIPLNTRYGTLSKGGKEKVQLVLVMSRRAKLYLLDEPIGGVDPATRDYILHSIVSNHDPDSTVLISTHLIADVEPVLDGFVFLHQGRVMRSGSAAQTRLETGMTLDQLFREVFRCFPSY